MFSMTILQPPFTLRSAAGLPSQPRPLAESVLVIIDGQIEYSEQGRLPLAGLDRALARIGSLLGEARDLESPVVHVSHQGSAGGLFDPTGGGRFLPSIGPADKEPVVHKSLPNAFAGTDLSSHLSQIGERPLVLVGFMTHMCVSSTARAALDLGYEATVVGDATATRSLPAVSGGPAIEAGDVQRVALAELADRFSIVTETSTLLT